MLGRLGALLACICLTPVVQASDFPRLKLPDAMQVKIVAGDLRMNGLTTRIYAFHSTKTADELVDYFSRQWTRMARSHAGPWDILAHRDAGFLITVQSRQANGLGETRGFIAFSNLFQAVEEGIKPPTVDVPMLPDTSVIQDLQAVDQGRPSRTLILRSGQSASQNLDFYRAYFHEQGYKPLAHGALVKGAAAGSMILNRGNEELNVAVAEQNGTTIVTIVRVLK